MDEQWVVDRTNLRELMKVHPDWTKRELGVEVGRSTSWVKKWRKRLRNAAPEDEQVLKGLSRARKHSPKRVTEEVVERILAIRDEPPDNLQRVPGPRTILYYLHQDEELKASGVYLPRSTSTVWAILREHQRILRHERGEHVPVERPAPMSGWQIDFKDISTVPSDPEGKQKHVIEVLNVVDVGTSILVEALPHAHYDAEQALLAMTEVFKTYGLPDTLTFDRDPRFVASWTVRDFPVAFVRFLLCLGVRVNILPPHRPDLNAFVERYHRSYQAECLAIYRPRTIEQVAEVTRTFQHHYNYERPNQALTCGNLPPRLAFQVLPLRPALPPSVDPDHWLFAIHRKRFLRRIRHNGSVSVDKFDYYLSQALAGRYVILHVDAHQQHFQVELDRQVIKTIPIKGLFHRDLAFPDYLDLIREQAVSEVSLARRHAQSQRRVSI